jgi:hypothetical protein
MELENFMLSEVSHIQKVRSPPVFPHM